MSDNKENIDSMVQEIKTYAELNQIDISNIDKVVPPMLYNIYMLVSSPFSKHKDPDLERILKQKIEGMLMVDSEEKYLQYIESETKNIAEKLDGIFSIKNRKASFSFGNTTELINKYKDVTPADKLKYLMDTAIKLNVKEDLGTVHDRLSDLMNSRLAFFNLCYALIVELLEHDPDHYQVCNCVKIKYSIIIFSDDLQEINEKFDQAGI